MRCCWRKLFIYLLLVKLSAQFAVFLQHVVHLHVMFVDHPLPQIDIAFVLDRDGLVVIFFILPIELLCLRCLFNFKYRQNFAFSLIQC